MAMATETVERASSSARATTAEPDRARPSLSRLSGQTRSPTTHPGSTRTSRALDERSALLNRSMLDERLKLAGVLGIEVAGAPQTTCGVHGQVDEVVSPVGTVGCGLDTPLGSIPALNERDDLVIVDCSISGRPDAVRRDGGDGLEVVVR